MEPRQKKVAAVLIGASVILIWRVYAVVTDRFPARVKAASVDAVAPMPPSSAKDAILARDGEETWNIQTTLAARPWQAGPFRARPDEPMQLDDDDDDDDVVAPGDERPQPPDFNFTGVSRVDDSFRAFAGDRVLRVGDIVAPGWEVIGITRRTATLASQEWMFRYELGVSQPTIRPRSETP
ncbi:MAG: hypothetical protein ACE5F9_13845 [Phycisphaerae bacterium]